MTNWEYRILFGLMGLAGIGLLLGAGQDHVAQAIAGAALLLTSVLIWSGWYVGHRLMLIVAGLAEIVRRLDEADAKTPRD